MTSWGGKKKDPLILDPSPPRVEGKKTKTKYPSMRDSGSSPE
jgi:hypothetical protein